MNHSKDQKKIKYVIIDNKAVVPSKAHPSDIGYDLTAIGIFKKISDRITLFETGIAISPPKGYYIEIVPRSSMSKTGYMLANSVGTIDPDYTGTLKVALIKVDTDMKDIELPFTKCQMVLRKAEYAGLELAETLSYTERGDGGFGSSDKYFSVEKKIVGDLLSTKEDERNELDTQTKLNMSLSDIFQARGISKEEEDLQYEGDDQGPTPEWWKKMTKEEQKDYLDRDLDSYQKELT